MGWGAGGRGNFGGGKAGFGAGAGGLVPGGGGPKGGGGFVPGGAASKGGGRGGGGGTKTPWSFVHVADAKDSLGLVALSKQIPAEWIDGKHGGRRSADRMHSTVLLKMTEKAHAERLKKVARETEPFRMEIRELFCERVERITDAEVYCIGVGLASSGLRTLKDTWCSDEPEDRRKIHVPYDGEGHISLAYVHAQFQPQAQEFCDDHVEVFAEGRTITVDHVTYQDEWGTDHKVMLGGGSDGPRAAKGARRGAPGQLMEIDGSVLEGGGQILRMSSSYSALFSLPINITKIRAGRSKPGLAAQHLESFRLVRDVSGATLTNDWVGSCEVKMEPKQLGCGRFSADPGTAGAITLMIQASLMPLMFTGGESNCDLRGGTDVGFSPPLDFLRWVLHPALARMGGDFHVECKQRGVFPKGGGHVLLQVPGVSGTLQAINLGERGDVKSVHAVLHATRPAGAEEQGARQAVQSRIAPLAPEVIVDFEVVECAAGAQKVWLDVVVETTSGALFHGGAEPKDLPGAKGGGKRGQSFRSWAEAALACAHEACVPLEKQLAAGGAVDEHLADQLILPASLAEGTSQLLCADLSMHAQTAIYIAEMLVPDVKIRQEKVGSLTRIEIDGIAHAAASRAAPSGASHNASSAPATEPAESAEKPSLSMAPEIAAAVPAAWQSRGGAKAAVAPAARKGGGKAAKVAAPPAAAAPPRTDPNEEVLVLKAGCLTRALPSQIKDFKTDMQQLGEFVHCAVQVDVTQDRIVFNGSPRERGEARKELEQILAFYQWSLS